MVVTCWPLLFIFVLVESVAEPELLQAELLGKLLLQVLLFEYFEDEYFVHAP